MADTLLRICRQLVRIDNRTDADLADAAGLSSETIRRLRDIEVELTYVRSTTIGALAKALHKHIELRGR